ncbi:MAG: putative type IX sorting system protein PorV2 [Luteibaculaceae bacterium]
MKFIYKLFTAVVFTCSVLALSGQEVRKYSNEFLQIGVSARALGMSNAFIATTDDVTSGYWNPAGLTRMEGDLQAAGMHAEYFAGIANYDYVGVAKRLDDKSVISFSFIRFGVDDIPNTTELIDAEGNIDYNRITSFSVADNAFLISYARQLGIEGLSFGASAKVVRRIIGEFGGSWGFGIDAGLQYERKKWIFAAMARDVTTTFNAWSFNIDNRLRDVFIATGNEIPTSSIEITMPMLILGASRHFDFNEDFNLKAEVNAMLTFDGRRNTVISGDPTSVDPIMGLEFGYKNVVFLRGGLGNLQYVQEVRDSKTLSYQPNIGVGLKIRNFSLDYALTNIGDTGGSMYSNVFSLRVDIYKQKK